MGNPDFNVDRQPVIRAVPEPVAVVVAAAPVAPPAAGLPPGVATAPRPLPSGGERPAIPQEQIVLPGEHRFGFLGSIVNHKTLIIIPKTLIS